MPTVPGYIRVDWYTQGLPTWGDGRLVILGTEGYIELRKYVDVAGRAGQDHLFVVDARRHRVHRLFRRRAQLLPRPGARRDQPHRDSLPPETHLRGDAAGNPRAAERDDDGVRRVNGSADKNAPRRDRRMRLDRPCACPQLPEQRTLSWSASSMSTQHAPLRLPQLTGPRRTAPAASSSITA